MLLFERRGVLPPLKDAEKLGHDLGITPRAAQLMLARGVEDGIEAEEFIHPLEAHMCDPFAFADMQRAVERIERAISKKERICIFGDYDADGVCATAILLMYLRSRGADVCYIIPSRHEEGYGMTANTPEQLHEAGAKLIITVDNGVKAVDELERCYALGMEAIVTDHHIPGETLPRVEALICCGADGGYPNADICGAGLAFKLVEAMAGRKCAMRYITLAGIATVADIVPLFGENRVFVKLALNEVNARRCPVGISALMEAAGGFPKKVTERTFGFTVAPRLNAAGRIEEATLSVELLVSEDRESAMAAAQRLNDLNDTRRAEEAEIFESACATLDSSDLCASRSIVLYDPSWNPGIVGIAAGRVAEKYYRPTVLLGGEGEIVKGSARSVPGVNIHDAMRASEELFLRFGGHAFAAGVTMKAENIDAFREKLDLYIRNNVAEEAFIPRETYDDDTEFTGVTTRLARDIELFAPFGEGNAQVKLRTDNVRIRKLVTMSDGKHLRFTLQRGDDFASGIYFYAGERFSQINAMESCDILYTPYVNEFNGRESLELNIQALRAAPVQDIGQYVTRSASKFADALSENIMYNSICAFSAFERADAEAETVKAARAGISGLAVFCFTRAGAERFLEFARREDLYSRMDIGFGACRGGALAYNAAVLAPVIANMDLSRYRTLVVFDTPLGMLGALHEAAPSAKIICARPVAGDADELADALVIGREELGTIYRALSRTEGVFYNRAVMEETICDALGIQRMTAAAAVGIFEELEFVFADGRGVRFNPDAPPKQLAQSRIFQSLNSVAEVNDIYIRSYEEAYHGS